MSMYALSAYWRVDILISQNWIEVSKTYEDDLDLLFHIVGVLMAADQWPISLAAAPQAQDSSMIARKARLHGKRQPK